MQPGGLPSIFCGAARLPVKLHQLSVPSKDLLSTSVKFSSIQETFHQLPSTFLQPVDLSNSVNFFAAGRPSVNFHAAGRPFINFRQLYVWPGDLLSTFCAATAPSINFRQLFVPLEDFLSTYVNFLCGHNNFSELSQWL